MTEIEYNDEVRTVFRDDDFKQLELLFEAYKLKNDREKLRSRLKSLEKMIKRENNKNLSNKIKAFKVVSTENSARLKNVMTRLNTSFNLFKLLKDLKSNHCYLENLENERKGKHIDLQEYEMTKSFYLQKILDINNCINHLREIAISYYHGLKNELILFEDKRIRLTTEKLRKKITKEEFNQKSEELELLKHQLEEKLAFLEVEIIELELD